MPALEALPLASLPVVMQPFEGGIFCGVITLPDCKHYAVTKLDAKPTKGLTWKHALEWAEAVGGRLPSRAIGGLLFPLAQELRLESDTPYWTDEQRGKRHAWCCYFDDGFSYGYADRSYGGGHGCEDINREKLAVAVRLIPLS